MRAVILAGGEGTRLRPLTLTMPKPALQLVDRPFLRYIIDWLARHGIDDVVVASGFRAGVLRDALGDDGIAYIEETEPLGRPDRCGWSPSGSDWGSASWS